jgi:integrase
MISYEGINSFSKLDSLLLNKIVQYFAKTNPGSMSHVINSLRKFVGYLYSKGLCNEFELNSSVYKVPRISKRVPCFTIDEVNKLLKCCNREIELDCRIRAIIMIAVTTGLRACDIANLKRKDIDWKNSTISILQEKTSKYIRLPLLVETGNAIANYILNFRGEILSNNDSIFIQHNRITIPIKSTTIKSQFERLCKKSEIENKLGRGFHGLRRSVATWLSEVSIDPHDIALFLGHSTFSSINKYIATNPEMAKCTHSFDGIPLISEVYHD